MKTDPSSPVQVAGHRSLLAGALVAAYVLTALAALIVAHLTPGRSTGSLLREAGRATGLVGFSLLALQVVLADIASRGIPEIVCLGDVIGYGPNPGECLELTRHADTLILGNHEEAVLLGEAVAFNTRARRAVDWTRERLMGEGVAPELAEDRRKLLEGFVADRTIEGIRYVHGSPRDPTREYITPRDASNRRKMQDIFGHVEHVCFIGHSHIPGVFTEEGFTAPEEMFNVYMLGEEKAVVNVGSVGQPRDGDTRACYCVFDVDTVVYHRLEYDVEATVAKIMATPGLDDMLAERLRLGR